MNLKMRQMSEAPVGEKVIRADDILAEITPEGYEYSDLGSVYYHGNAASRLIYFRRIAPLVEYEYVTDGKIKPCDFYSDEYIFHDGKFALFRDCGGGAYHPQLHFRRVEVKR